MKKLIITSRKRKHGDDESDDENDDTNPKRMKASKLLIFTQLPEELVVFVLSFLKYRYTVHSLTLVSRQFHQMISGGGEITHALWKLISQHQVINLCTFDEFRLESMQQMLPKLRPVSVAIGESYCGEILLVVESFVEKIVLTGEFPEPVLPDDVKFANLTDLCYASPDQTDSVLTTFFFSHTNCKRILVADASMLDEFSCIEVLKSWNTIKGDGSELVPILNNNRNTLKTLEFDDFCELDPAEAFVQSWFNCSALTYLDISPFMLKATMTPCVPVALQNLTTLKISLSLLWLESVFSIEYKHLNELQITVLDSPNHSRIVIKPLTQLRKLSYTSAPDVSLTVSSQFLNAVSENLESLELSAQDSWLYQIDRFKRLKYLIVNSNSSVKQMVQSSPFLESITFSIRIHPSEILLADSVHNLKRLMCDRMIYSTRSIDYELSHILFRATKLQVLSVPNVFSNVSQLLQLHGQLIRQIYVTLDISDDTALFYMLPSRIDYVDVIARMDIKIETYALLTICCHFVDVVKVKCHRRFPIGNLMPEKKVLIGQGCYFVRKLKRILLEQLHGNRLVIDNDARSRIEADYNRVLQSEESFARLKYYYPALNALYKTARRALVDIHE